MTRPFAIMWMMRCWIPENSFTSLLNLRSIALPAEKMRHDEIVVNDIYDKVLDSRKLLHQLIKFKINCAIPVEKVRHDKTIGNDVDDEVLDPENSFHQLIKFKINCVIPV
jgi:hypothetical protein